jgi:aspartate aminotransferase
MISSPELIKGLTITHYHIMACPSSPYQHAALAAINGPQDFLNEMREEFQRRRDLIVDKLNAIDGLNCVNPQGAFYVFPSYKFEISAVDLAMKLASAGVITSPGTAFGPRGEGHIRFSYAASRETIEKGVEIVNDVFKNL